MPHASSPSPIKDYAETYWASLATLYTPTQVNLLKAFTKVVARDSWSRELSLLEFAPQWFEGAEPIKGTKSLAPSPSLDPESRTKFDVLWSCSRRDPTCWSGVFANAFLWEACFPVQFHARLPSVTSVLDFDPETSDLASEIRRMSSLEHRARGLTSAITLLDCYRIPGEVVSELRSLMRADLGEAVRQVRAPQDDAPGPGL